MKKTIMKEKIKKDESYRKGYQAGIAEENEAWLRRERCSICGKTIKPKLTTDTCDECFDER